MIVTDPVRNADLVRAGYANFAAGNLEALARMFHPECVWHAQRLGQLGGDHVGWPAIVQFFARTMELTRGTFRVELADMLANDTLVAAIVHSTGERDGQRLDDRQVHLFRLEGDQVREVWQYVGDGEAVEVFWA